MKKEMEKITLEELTTYARKGYEIILYEDIKEYPVEINEHYGLHLLIEPICVEIRHKDELRIGSPHIIVYGYRGGGVKNE